MTTIRFAGKTYETGKSVPKRELRDAFQEILRELGKFGLGREVDFSTETPEDVRRALVAANEITPREITPRELLAKTTSTATIKYLNGAYEGQLDQKMSLSGVFSEVRSESNQVFRADADSTERGADGTITGYSEVGGPDRGTFGDDDISTEEMFRRNPVRNGVAPNPEFSAVTSGGGLAVFDYLLDAQSGKAKK